MAKSNHYYTRAERKTMIVTAIACKLQAHGICWLTIHEIAEQIGMVRSTHLEGIIGEMCADGVLQWRIAPRPGYPEVREFTLADGTYTIPKRRAIPIKAKGVPVGQMELF